MAIFLREVVDVETTCDTAKVLNCPGTAVAELSCTETSVPCDKFDALHTEIDASPLE